MIDHVAAELEARAKYFKTIVEYGHLILEAENAWHQAETARLEAAITELKALWPDAEIKINTAASGRYIVFDNKNIWPLDNGWLISGSEKTYTSAVDAVKDMESPDAKI